MMLWKVMLLMMFATSVVAQSLSDKELFEQGRQAYSNGKYVEAAMKLYAYKLRNPIALQDDDNHRQQVNKALAFCQEQPQIEQNKLRQNLAACRKDLQGMAEQCNAQYVASTTSYMIHRPKLDHLGATAKIPKAWPLVCRGGGQQQLTWSNYTQKGVDNALMLFFKKGNRGVGKNKSALEPGQCSWKDRGMHQAEPSVLCYGLGKQRFNVSWLLDRQQHKFRYKNLPGDLKKLSNNKYAEFQVYNNSKGCLVVAPKLAFMIKQPVAPKNSKILP